MAQAVNTKCSGTSFPAKPVRFPFLVPGQNLVLLGADRRRKAVGTRLSVGAATRCQLLQAEFFPRIIEFWEEGEEITLSIFIRVLKKFMLREKIYALHPTVPHIVPMFPREKKE